MNEFRIQDVPRMIGRVLGVVIREHGALHQLEMVQGIHDGGVDAALVGTFIMHPAVVVLLQGRLLKESPQHIRILHLTHANDTQWAVLRHGQDGLVHVVAFFVEAALRPMLHAVLGESVVGLGAIHKGVEEVLHVPKGNADRLVLRRNDSRHHETNQAKQDNSFHKARILFPLQM